MEIISEFELARVWRHIEGGDSYLDVRICGLKHSTESY